MAATLHRWARVACQVTGQFKTMSTTSTKTKRDVHWQYMLLLHHTLELRTHDWKVAGSYPCRSSGRIFFSKVNFLCSYFSIRFTPDLPVACKRPQTFCQKAKCMWYGYNKYTCTLCMWLCLKWHGAWLFGVHRTHWDGSSFMWHQPCQCCKYTTLVDIQKYAIKAIHSCRITCVCNESAW